MKNEALVKSIAEETNLRPSEVSAVLEALEATILNQCDMGEDVVMHKFFTFKRRLVKGRTYVTNLRKGGKKVTKTEDSYKLKAYSSPFADEFLN